MFSLKTPENQNMSAKTQNILFRNAATVPYVNCSLVASRSHFPVWAWLSSQTLSLMICYGSPTMHCLPSPREGASLSLEDVAQPRSMTYGGEQDHEVQELHLP